MILSRDKVNCITKAIMGSLDKDDFVDFLKDDADIRRKIISVINNELSADEDIDNKIRKRLASYFRKIEEGTNEWDILYRKLFEEESKKRIGKN